MKLAIGLYYCNCFPDKKYPNTQRPKKRTLSFTQEKVMFEHNLSSEYSKAYKCKINILVVGLYLLRAFVQI
jgi:hypothetical protein